MRNEDKRDRRYRVLEMIIKHHTETAEPIGSTILAEDLGLSSATVRNVMFELEEMGFVRQPHTSAGRVPTDRGYRAYVDMLMRSKGAEELDTSSLEDVLSYLTSDSIEDILLKGIELCSSLTSQACVASSPFGAPSSPAERLYFGGASHLTEQPEFRDALKIGTVLKMLEDKKTILQLLEEDSRIEGIKTHIGSENKYLGFEECTLITATYSVRDAWGALGVIGPMRMRYEDVIPTVSRVARSVSRLFEEFLQRR